MPRTLVIIITLIAGTAGLALGHQQRALQHAHAQLRQLAPGPVDIGFSQSMLAHHQQAVAMSQILLDGKPTGLAAFARVIAATQTLELGEMQGWLQLWQQPLQQADNAMTWMQMGDKPLDDALTQYLIDCRSSAQGMPGMASAEDLSRLRELSGRERDELFIRLMLAHHQGGIPMARFAAEQARLPRVKQLAAHMLLEQSREVAQMQSILALLEASPRSQQPPLHAYQ